MTASKSRADELLAASGVAADLRQARGWIMAGKIMATDGRGRERKIDKAGEVLDACSTFRILGAKNAIPYVSRGGVKLAAALDAFHIDVRDLICADIGVSTGGFTDCLLQRGAERVHGVDVGYGQTAWSIRTDPRVVLYERTNARQLGGDTFGEAMDLVVVDVSFIGLRQLLSTISPLLSETGCVVALIKPQFELPASKVGEGGIVRDDDDRASAVHIVEDAAITAGLVARATIESPITGTHGNVEYLTWLTR